MNHQYWSDIKFIFVLYLYIVKMSNEVILPTGKQQENVEGRRRNILSV